ncbi:hypothetical protein, partial [Staphylococcus pasteuri]|uniref:hypothetical protein n=1 Tax=Staphylococcus pasteuri TaxID=45972 RepID=UPI0012B7D475
DPSKPKLQGDQGMVHTFTNLFPLPQQSLKLAPALQPAPPRLFPVTFLTKTPSRLPSLATISLLRLPTYKHFEPRHPKKPPQHPLHLLPLPTLTLLHTFDPKRK